MSKLNTPFNKIGVDVSKKKLDIAIDESTVITIENTPAAYSEFLSRLEYPLSQLHVVMEASGGYERRFADYLLSQSIAVSVVNAKRVRDYAKAMGQLAKNDTIDAQVIRAFAKAIHLTLIEKKSHESQQLEGLVKRRQQLVKLQTIEKQHLETTLDKTAIASIKALLKQLAKQIESLDSKINCLMENSASFQQRKQVVLSAKGLGEQTAAMLLIQLPELGQLSHKQVSALVGVAPYCNDSGPRKGQKAIWGGRKIVRSSLYMPMLSAIQYNPLIKAFYKRLIAKGKVRKVAVIACMRKLLTILNSMLKNNTQWDDNYANIR
jgi:transposase